jgi:fibrillarin-like pre-rRNA processing protein
LRAPTPLTTNPASPRLGARARGDRTELWTETVGSPPEVYGERWASLGGREFRSFEPGRSKLAAAIARGWTGPLPRPGERWLYLGAASGTTASHVADLLGPTGRLYAVERSLRPFARLLGLAARWPNLLPLLGDAREPEGYADVVPIVDGIYADVAQPDQVALVLANVTTFLRDRGGAVLLALKASSMGRERAAAAHLKAAESELAGHLTLAPPVRLDPFYRSHFLLGGGRGWREGARRPEPARPRRRERLPRRARR